MATGRHHLLTNQLIRAARGLLGKNGGQSPLPCFPLQHHHFGKLNKNDDVATPSDFHIYLCNKIRYAQDRIVLASLYIGVGSRLTDVSIDSLESCNCNSKEDELLDSLHHASINNNLNKVKILLDANRALRKVSVTNKNTQSHGSSSDSSKHTQLTNSARAIHSRIDTYVNKSNPLQQKNHNMNGIFLFHVNDKRLCTILPSPLDEIAGVFHIKCYIVDDELILSGANLSEQYFNDRLDRYMLFTNGGGGLVDWYADLIDVLSEYAIRYDGHSNERTSQLSSLLSIKDEMKRKQKLEHSLINLFDGSNYNMLKDNDRDEEIIAWAVPTFQMPSSFLGREPKFQSDSEVTRILLLSALNSDEPMSVRLSSAYLNLTPKLMSVLNMFGQKRNSVGNAYILTAGTISHGFAAPKAVDSQIRAGFVDNIKATIPEAFMTLVKEIAKSIISNGGKVLLYERSGWTFHAKGLWLTSSTHSKDSQNEQLHLERINDSSSLQATIVGSGNYGARSEALDVESNCILIFNDDSTNTIDVKKSLAAEWNSMCDSSTEMKDITTNHDNNKVMQVVLGFMKRFL